MAPIDSFKSFALFSFIIGAIAGSLMVLKGPKNKARSISFHAGTAKNKIYFFYALAFLTATILFYLFCMFWFIPVFNLPLGFPLLLNTMTILLILTALIPQAGKKEKLHAIVAYGFAFLMMLLLFFIAVSANFSLFARVLSGISIGSMTSFWYLFFFSPYKEKVATHYLLFQSTYVVLFFLSILAATYIR